MTCLLRFEDVALRRGGRLLFERLDFLLARGELFQVAGPNGSGKSSLLRLAAGLLNAERGHVERSGVALAADQLALDRELPLRAALSFWTQSPDDGLEALGIADLADIPVRLLSSGQAKRAMLARVVASGAPLWLLDEPLNGLDAGGSGRLAEILARHLERGGGVLAASHQPLPGKSHMLELGS
jgi:heme exporter protein A